MAKVSKDGADKASETVLGIKLPDIVRKGLEDSQGIFSNLLQRKKLLALIVGGILLVIIAFWVIDKITYYFLARRYVDQIGDAFDLNKNLVDALVIVTLIVAVYFGNLVWSFSKQKRMIGIAGIATLLIGHSLLLWWATRTLIINDKGFAMKCYVIARDGSVTYRERAGIDPATGRQCRPVTVEMVERLREYEKGRRPQLISSKEPVFFDPRSGEPVIWFYQSKNNGIEIFDLMGFDPDTGEELTPVTKEVAEAWKQQAKRLGARVPQQVDPKKYGFFDPRSGAPRVWYWRDKTGRYEFYDSPGYHPRTGQQLSVVTPEVAADSQTMIDHIPQRVDINNYSPFDPKTGEARVWYSKDSKGSYEFFDSPGFHPRSGDKLNLFTKDVMQNWERDLKEEREKLEKDRKKHADDEDRLRQVRLVQEATDRENREKERARLNQAASQCDQLAANPSDQRRVGDGVSFDALQANAAEAVSSCELAFNQNPNELRFKYQLGRALHWSNRARAFTIFQELVTARYPAAYDNLGWLYLTERKNPAQAIQLFKTGMALNDSDSMISLAEMISRGHLAVSNPAEEKTRLLCRAAQLGNPAAVTACQTATAEAQQTEQNRLQQVQQQQLMLQFMGGVLGGMQHR